MAVALMERAEPGRFISSAISSLQKNSTMNPMMPIIIISVLESLNTRSASLNWPTAHLSETILEMATGKPAVANTRRKLYSEYAGE